jgi:hypothetical protein
MWRIGVLQDEEENGSNMKQPLVNLLRQSRSIALDDVMERGEIDVTRPHPPFLTLLKIASVFLSVFQR